VRAAGGEGRGQRFGLRGVIAGCGFASGDRVVVGHWASSPIGPFSDVMWARPDGERVLHVADERSAAFITAVYAFDRVEVACLHVRGDGRSVDAEGPHWSLRLHASGGWRIPGGTWRPPWFTRLAEGPVARAAMGVRTYGTSPSGVREWYRADAWRWIDAAHATVAGEDLGGLAPVDPPCGFGFSEPPTRPAITEVRPLLQDPSGRLDQVVAELVGT
jgi:hypothetical protein